jgi:hypothetical protein
LAGFELGPDVIVLMLGELDVHASSYSGRVEF